VRGLAQGAVAVVFAMAATSCAAGAGSAVARTGAAAAAVNGCKRGLFVVDGACLGPREVDAFCGARSLGPGCVTAVCGPGEAVDLRAGGCVPQRSVRATLDRQRPTAIPDGTTLACHDDHLLVANADHAVCLERSDACPRTTHFEREQPSSRGCVPDPLCASGEVRTRGACVRVVTGGALDVGAWARAILGPDGGAGGDRLCRVLAQAPWDFDVGPGGSRAVGLAIDLRFPDNDVTGASASVAADGPSSGLLAAQSAVDSLLIPLRALGGTAGAASASVHVSCLLRGATSPLLLPP
jgi:hypothetical protein